MILDLYMHLKHDRKTWKTKVIELKGETVGNLHFFSLNNRTKAHTHTNQ